MATKRTRRSFSMLFIVLVGCGAAQPASPGDASSGANTAGEGAQEAAATDLVENLPNGRYHPDANLYTAGKLSEQELQLAQSAGVQAVVNLRTEEEMRFDEQAVVEGLDMQYVHIPIAGGDSLTLERAQALDEALQGQQGTTLVHCSSSNRVGALFALRAAWVQGRSTEEAIEVGKAHGLTSLEDQVRERLEAASNAP